MDCPCNRSLPIRQSTDVHGRCGVQSRSACGLAALIGWLPAVLTLGAALIADGAEAVSGVADSAESPNHKAVAWLDRFASEQVLYRAQDLAVIRQEMVKASPEKAQRWLDETAAVRRKMDSREWQETRKWLNRFLEVQAIYTDKEVDEFHNKVLAATPSELGKIMREIEARRSTRSRKANAAARRRQQMLEINKSRKREQFAQRQVVRRAASQAANFATTKSTKVKGKPSYAVRLASRARLISAFEVARWSVYRAIWSRW